MANGLKKQRNKIEVMMASPIQECAVLKWLVGDGRWRERKN
jgi:hypothetical protein